jgi:hypothetical protein
MNYVRIVNRCAVIELSDSDKSEHHDIVREVSDLLNMKFKLFLLDFRMVNKFSSHIFGFTLGIVKSVLSNVGNGSRVFVRGLGPDNVEMVGKAILIFKASQEDIDLYGKDIYEVKIVCENKGQA